jgi:hypothetical protein
MLYNPKGSPEKKNIGINVLHGKLQDAGLKHLTS